MFVVVVAVKEVVGEEGRWNESEYILKGEGRENTITVPYYYYTNAEKRKKGRLVSKSTWGILVAVCLEPQRIGNVLRRKRISGP